MPLLTRDHMFYCIFTFIGVEILSIALIITNSNNSNLLHNLHRDRTNRTELKGVGSSGVDFHRARVATATPKVNWLLHPKYWQIIIVS